MHGCGSLRLGSSPAIGEARPRLCRLALSVQHLAADLDRAGGDQHERDDARYGAPINPVMDRAALYQHVAGLQMDRRVVELHVNLARHHDGIVDRIGAMISWARSRSE